jgi:hypothetical protein
VDREMLDDLGVNIIEDNSSRDSSSSRQTHTLTILTFGVIFYVLVALVAEPV